MTRPLDLTKLRREANRLYGNAKERQDEDVQRFIIQVLDLVEAVAQIRDAVRNIRES